MNSRLVILVLVVTLAAGAALGVYVGASFAESSAPLPPQGLQLTTDDQKDYILNIADAYAVDANLKLAQDRLARLHDPQIAARVEELAIEYAAQRNSTSINLARLAVATGSRIRSFVALFVTATPAPTRTSPPTNAPLFSNVRATAAPTEPVTPTPVDTAEPIYVVVPNANPFLVLPTETPTITPTPLPRTRVPTATQTLIPTDVPPPPYPIFEPDKSRWPGTIYYEPANVQPGEGYWHLTHAVYCDAFDPSDDSKYNFGCDERPGGGAGTSIYVMSGGNFIDVWSGGVNVADDPTIVGDKKNPDDMCQCDYTFEDADYKINVRDAPSDAIGGFCMCSVNFGWGSRAHVRYFLYFEYRIR